VIGLAVAGQQLAVHFGEDLSGMPVQPVERGGDMQETERPTAKS
jgi:hypothetical protein